MRSRTASLPSQPPARREALGSHGPTKRAGGRLIQDKARLVAFMHSALGCRVPDPRSSYDDHAASQPPPIRPMSPPLSHTDGPPESTWCHPCLLSEVATPMLPNPTPWTPASPSFILRWMLPLGVCRPADGTPLRGNFCTVVAIPCAHRIPPSMTLESLGFRLPYRS